jgi:hypothetical protein
LTKGFDYFYFKLNRTASYIMKQMGSWENINEIDGV